LDVSEKAGTGDEIDIPKVDEWGLEHPLPKPGGASSPWSLG